jgi:DNA repair exonuclease SbcCD ATPase subunit
MEGGNGGDLRQQLKEREAELRELRQRLEQVESENDRLGEEIQRLRKELKAAGRRPHCQANPGKRKKQRKRAGRKAGQGRFAFRSAPATSAAGEPPAEVPVTITECPCCGGELRAPRRRINIGRPRIGSVRG